MDYWDIGVTRKTHPRAFLEVVGGGILARRRREHGPETWREQTIVAFKAGRIEHPPIHSQHCLGALRCNRSC